MQGSGVDGTDKLLKQLGNISKQMRRKYLRQGVQSASKPIYDEARRGAKEVQDTGVLWRSLGRKIKLYQSATFGLGIVGVRKGYAEDKPVKVNNGATYHKNVIKYADGTFARRNPAKYLHLVELGRRVIEVVKKKVLSNKVQVFGKRVAAYGGAGFLRRAWIVGSRAGREAMRKTLDNGIKEAIRGA